MASSIISVEHLANKQRLCRFISQYHIRPLPHPPIWPGMRWNQARSTHFDTSDPTALTSFQ